MYTKKVYETKAELSKSLGSYIIAIAKSAIADHGFFGVGLSGGSIIGMLSSELCGNAEADWENWRLFFCDERYVPQSDPESTYGQYHDKVIAKVGFADSWYPINSSVSLEECAADYKAKLSGVFSNCGDGEFPKFDLLLLGMGPDGHTCSLFPGHPLLAERSAWIAPIADSPKPPPGRITMTYPVLNNARNVAFVCTGAGKGPVLKTIFSTEDVNSPSMPPAGRVKPVDGELVWFLDKAADLASHL